MEFLISDLAPLAAAETFAGSGRASGNSIRAMSAERLRVIETTTMQPTVGLTRSPKATGLALWQILNEPDQRAADGIRELGGPTAAAMAIFLRPVGGSAQEGRACRPPSLPHDSAAERRLRADRLRSPRSHDQGGLLSQNPPSPAKVETRTPGDGPLRVRYRNSRRLPGAPFPPTKGGRSRRLALAPIGVKQPQSGGSPRWTNPRAVRALPATLGQTGRSR
jgi:hypothetical protein